jgi:chemotaxis protein methyltransferase CheR
MDAGDWGAALRSWDDALSREGARPESFVGRGQALEQLGRLAEAEAAYRRALYLAPGFALGHYHLARLLARAGRTGAARKSLANARQILLALAPGQVLDVPEGLTVAGLLELVELSQKRLLPLAA